MTEVPVGGATDTGSVALPSPRSPLTQPLTASVDKDAIGRGERQFHIRIAPGEVPTVALLVFRAACVGVSDGSARSGMPAGLVVAAQRHHDRERNAAVATAAAADLRLTCHAAGAAPGPAARDAGERFGVRRIGHGTHVSDDPGTLDRIADHGVVSKVCPTSNWYIEVAFADDSVRAAWRGH